MRANKRNRRHIHLQSKSVPFRGVIDAVVRGTEASRTGTAETDGDEDRRTGRANRGEQRGNLDRGQDNRETETTRGRDSRTGRGQGAPDGETDTGDGESWPEDGRTPPENPRRPLGRWQTQGNAPNPCAGSTQRRLASPEGPSSPPLRLEPSLQWLWRSIIRLLADNGVRGEY